MQANDQAIWNRSSIGVPTNKKHCGLATDQIPHSPFERATRKGHASETTTMRAPRFLYSNVCSKCHKAPTLLVRSREGGFVTRNCLKCGNPDWVSVEQLPKLDCEICGSLLTVEKLDGYNYFYVCARCKRNWELSRFLPHWSELFDYFGLIAPNEVPR